MERHGMKARVRTQPATSAPRDNDARLWMEPDQARALKALLHADGYDERACRDPEAWDYEPIPVRSNSGGDDARRKRIDNAEQIAVRVRACHHCPVLTACRAYARTKPYVTGVLAGTTDAERGGRRKRRTS